MSFDKGFALVPLLGVICALAAIIASKKNDKPLDKFPHPTLEVIELAEKGEKVKAIKLYREITGVGLYDANRVVSNIR